MISFDIFRLMGSGKQDFSSTSGILSLEKLECYCVILNKTLSAPPICEYTCVNSSQRKYNENLHREITTANWGLATTNQPTRGQTFQSNDVKLTFDPPGTFYVL